MGYKTACVGSERDYLVSYVDYGSCSCCDTLQSIQFGKTLNEKLSEQSVKDYMTLCLHLIQHMKAPYKNTDDFKEVKDIVNE